MAPFHSGMNHWQRQWLSDRLHKKEQPTGPAQPTPPPPPPASNKLDEVRITVDGKDGKKPMKTLELAPQTLGTKQDWLGNNAAFECPVCGQVFIVSSFLKHERCCPRCGQSRGRVTGSFDKGGKAILSWDDFSLGQCYARDHINQIL